MIVLDTNVLSEPMRTSPAAGVLNWIESQEDAAITSISVGELLTGVRRLPRGRRRSGLLRAVEQTLSAFAGSILLYDDKAARAFAEMQERRRSAGTPLGVEDGMIAAICATHSARLATRNVKNFENLDLVLVNPWSNR